MMKRSDAPSALETHISTLFFAGERVYKLAKRVDLPFLRTVEVDERLRGAERELELNRRFSPDVYIGLADIIEGEHVVDRMVVMRRLPADRQLSRLLVHGDWGDCLRRTARRVATLHASSPAEKTSSASIRRLEENWHANFSALEPHVGTTIDPDAFSTVRRLATEFLGQSRQLRTNRISEGHVRDGHGDLTADDVYCLDDGPRILDCLAFDDQLRVDDVLNDIAFLVMDVHRLVGPAAARELMVHYQEFSNEHHPPSLAHHYVAYRAHVRAKVACLRVEQGDMTSRSLANEYHTLALHHLRRARLGVIMIGGGPGVGKTLLSKRLADHYGYVRLATDEIRHDLARIPHGQHAFAPLDSEAYAPDVVDATYAEQAREACELVAAGYGVILDASWTTERQRRVLRDAIGAIGIDVVEIECTLDPAIARERIARRLANPDDPSDATPDLVDALNARREPWHQAHRIDTSASVDEIVDRALNIVDAPP